MKIRTLTLATLICSAFSHNAFADDGIFRARIGFSENDYSTIWSGGDLKVDYTSINYGASYIFSNAFYADLSYKTNDDGEWNTCELLQDANCQTSYFNNGGQLVNADVSDQDYDRDDLTLTIGKVLENGIQLFGGYQQSESDIDLPDELFPVADGFIDKEEIDLDGFFFGIGKAFSVGPGSLNLNFAYALMDAELIDSIGEKSKGDGDGYSLGLAYSYYFTDNLGLNLEYKMQRYSYDFDLSQSAAAQVTSGDDDLDMFGINFIGQF